ncbi:hypothetical protein ABTY63_45715, partial [Streptomyces solisilvae]
MGPLRPARRFAYSLRGGSLLAALGMWQLFTTLGISLWLRFAWFPSAAYVVREFAERGGVGVCWQDPRTRVRGEGDDSGGGVADAENEVEFFFLRPRDIAVYVGSGRLDIGITG